MKTKQEGAQKALTLDDLRSDKQNPRTIKPKAAKGLAASMRDFGDLSGIVFNDRTGELVTAHQRVDQGRKAGAVVVDGALVMPNGERFVIRRVDWTPSKQRAANVAANNPSIAGDFDESIGAVLEQIKIDIPEIQFGELCFDGLIVQTLDALPVLPTGEKSPYQQMTFILHDDQAEQVKKALDVANGMGEYVNIQNENSKGNGLARVCEIFLTVST
jgi:hypothetical protein